MPTSHHRTGILKPITALLALLALSQFGSPAPRVSLAARASQAASISLTPIADVTSVNGSHPITIAHAGDGSGRLFVVEQPGRIMIYNGTQLLPTAFLNITSIVNSGDSEQGLLGLAFDPQYTTNGYFYVDYINKSSTEGATVVARYHVSASNPNVADSSPPTTLLTITQPQTNHNGGQLQFGPGGYLYISTGDGGNGDDAGPGHNPAIGNAQDRNSLLGKILRIDVHNNNTADGLPYDIPPSNPFANDGNPNTRGEIWAYGLRNPWRFTFDRQTGDMFIGDVGQGTWEEIDFQPGASTGGENYGWRCKEGDEPFTSDSHCASETFVTPIFVYDHSQGRCSVTGGYRYRGTRYLQLVGTYFYADYCGGQIWGATRSGANWTTTPLLDSSALISTFGEDDSGELYLADRTSGKIYRIDVPFVPSHFVHMPIVRR
ncbi:MAG TPA: PQQ-dependent sugar dehydrogenase [Roseiflexaceae bacterium]